MQLPMLGAKAVPRYYFDHNATTPVSDEALAAFTAEVRSAYGNASSIHHFGREARMHLETARQQVAWMLCCDRREVVWVSGGTEANNLAIVGTIRRFRRTNKHVITTVIEHPAVLKTCNYLEREGVEVTYVPVGSSGIVDPDDVKRALRPETVLISAMHINNEIGTIQPVEEIAAIAREAGVTYHSDGVQAGGKLPLHHNPPAADLYSLSGHKFYGLKGSGALMVRLGTRLKPVLHGGSQEHDRRPGTENVPGAVAMGAAADWARKNVEAESARLAALRDRLEQNILDRIPDCGVNGSGPRVANTTNIYFDAAGGEAMLIALDLKGFAVATGSACSSGAVEPSHVILALGASNQRARSSIRFSLGRSNDESQVDALADAVVEATAKLRHVSGKAVTSA
jgi:cysteine desulfurase